MNHLFKDTHFQSGLDNAIVRSNGGRCRIGKGVQDEVAIVLFLEAHDNKDRQDLSDCAEEQPSCFANCVDSAIRNCSPTTGESKKAIVHTELLFPPRPGDKRTFEDNRNFFATYIYSFGTDLLREKVEKRSCAQWQNKVYNYEQAEAYYLCEMGALWRAVPVVHQCGDQLERAADSCIGAPYSILRYVTSVKWLRWFSRFLSNDRKASAHCATLVARVLEYGFGPKTPLAHTAAWYSPASLYNELVRTTPFQTLRPRKSETTTTTPKATTTKEIQPCVENVRLLNERPFDSQIVYNMGDEQCAEALRECVLRMQECAHSEGEKEATDARRIQLEKELAKLALYWVFGRCNASSIAEALRV